MQQTTRHLGALLEDLQDNPRTTLVALFLNAVREMEYASGANNSIAARPAMMRAMQFLKPTKMPTTAYDLVAVLTSFGKDFFCDMDGLFDA